MYLQSTLYHLERMARVIAVLIAAELTNIFLYTPFSGRTGSPESQIIPFVIMVGLVLVAILALLFCVAAYIGDIAYLAREPNAVVADTKPAKGKAKSKFWLVTGSWIAVLIAEQALEIFILN